MMMAHLHEVIPVAVERALDSLAGGLLMCGLAWTWLRVARRQNSASRFFILFILLIGIAALPFVGLSLLHSGSSAGVANQSLITLPGRFAEYLFIAWAMIVSVLLMRIVAGFLQLQRLRQSCVAIDIRSLDIQTQTALRECPRPVALCVSERVSVPTALGLAAPAKIAIPAWLMDQLSPGELHHLVLHELAHLRRWDDWTNLIQRVLGAVLFFHPAVWWLQSRISLEREMACDECVLAETGNARAYAQSLATIAERSFVRRTMALAQAAVSRLHDTTLRVARILSPAPHRTSKLRIAGSAAVVGGISLAMALYSPDLIGFTVPQPTGLSAESLDFAPQTLKPLPASYKLPETAAKPVASAKLNSAVQHKKAAAPIESTQTVARTETKHDLFVPVNHVERNHANDAQPAVLVVWQEAVSTDGSVVTVEQTYWRVVVYHPENPKESPAKIT